MFLRLDFFNHRDDAKGRILIQVYRFMNSVKMVNMDLVNLSVDMCASEA